MSNRTQDLLALVGGILVVIIGFLAMTFGGPTYSMFGWLLIIVGALTTVANVALRRQQR